MKLLFSTKCLFLATITFTSCCAALITTRNPWISWWIPQPDSQPMTRTWEGIPLRKKNDPDTVKTNEFRWPPEPTNYSYSDKRHFGDTTNANADSPKDHPLPGVMKNVTASSLKRPFPRRQTRYITNATSFKPCGSLKSNHQIKPPATNKVMQHAHNKTNATFIKSTASSKPMQYKDNAELKPTATGKAMQHQEMQHQAMQHKANAALKLTTTGKEMQHKHNAALKPTTTDKSMQYQEMQHQEMQHQAMQHKANAALKLTTTDKEMQHKHNAALKPTTTGIAMQHKPNATLIPTATDKVKQYKATATLKPTKTSKAKHYKANATLKPTTTSIVTQYKATATLKPTKRKEIQYISTATLKHTTTKKVKHYKATSTLKPTTSSKVKQYKVTATLKSKTPRKVTRPHSIMKAAHAPINCGGSPNTVKIWCYVTPAQDKPKSGKGNSVVEVIDVLESC